MIEKINLNWDGSIEFRNFYLGDHHNDTLIYISKLNTSLKNLKNIKNRSFEFSDLDAQGLYLKIKKYKGDKTHSLKILLDKLKKKNNNKLKSLFVINKMFLDKMTFVYSDENIEKQNPLKLNSLKIKAENFNLKNDEFTLSLKKIEGLIDSSFNKKIKGSALVGYKPGLVKLDNMKLSSGKSILNGNLIVKGKNNSLSDFKSNATISMEILKSKLDLASFNFDNNNKYRDLPLTDFTFNLNGTLESFIIDNLHLKNNFLDFDGKIIAKKIFNDFKKEFNLKTDSLILDLRKLKTFSFLSKNFRNQIPNISKLRLNGNTSLNNNFVEFKINSKNDWGQINSFGNIELNKINKKNPIKYLKIASDIEEIDLSIFNSKRNVFLYGKFNLEGKFFDKDKPEVYWDLENGIFYSKEFLINNINAKGRIEEQKLRNTLSINSKLLQLKSDLLYDFSKEIPTTTLLANINRWDINKLGFKFGDNKQEFRGIISSNLKGKN